MAKRFISWALLIFMVATLTACVVAPRTAPPPPRREMRSASPGAAYFWVPGHWKWRHGDWYWIRGHWEKKRRGKVWVPGHWERRGNRRAWIPGHWRKRRR